VNAGRGRFPGVGAGGEAGGVLKPGVVVPGLGSRGGAGGLLGPVPLGVPALGTPPPGVGGAGGFPGEPGSLTHSHVAEPNPPAGVNVSPPGVPISNEIGPIPNDADGEFFAKYVDFMLKSTVTKGPQLRGLAITVFSIL